MRHIVEVYLKTDIPHIALTDSTPTPNVQGRDTAEAGMRNTAPKKLTE